LAGDVLRSGSGVWSHRSAVVADILNIAALLKVERGGVTRSDGTPLLDPLLACSHQHYCAIAPMDELITRFYARFITSDTPGVIGKLGTSFGNHNVSLESVVQTDVRGDRAEIVVVTHNVREGNFRLALEEIRLMSSVSSIASTLRVL
jgi:homoserine dehydrogenase (EC 1.1.1.3)